MKTYIALVAIFGLLAAVSAQSNVGQYLSSLLSAAPTSIQQAVISELNSITSIIPTATSIPSQSLSSLVSSILNDLTAITSITSITTETTSSTETTTTESNAAATNISYSFSGIGIVAAFIISVILFQAL